MVRKGCDILGRKSWTQLLNIGFMRFYVVVYTTIIVGRGFVFTHSLCSVQNEYLNLYVVFANGFVCMP